MAGDATGSVMRAGDVGRAARRDLQFRIPRRPVVRLGLRARPEETGWIIDGARKSQVLGGAFAREHMGPLLQACDGTRTLDEIGEVTGVGPQAAFEAVSLLWTGGIVEEGDTEPAPGDPPPELARLLSRLGDSTGVNDSWQDAARRLAGMYHCIAVLKGRGTLIATPGGEVYHNPTGSAGLAKGGSGDILAGLLSGLLAAGLKQGRTAEDAAIAAVWLHGAAGDRCAKRLGMAAMLPHDIFADLGAIFAELER